MTFCQFSTIFDNLFIFVGLIGSNFFYTENLGKCLPSLLKKRFEQIKTRAIYGFDKNNITKTASLTVITLLASMLSGHIPDASEIGTIKITSKCHKNSYVLYIASCDNYICFMNLENDLSRNPSHAM